MSTSIALPHVSYPLTTRKLDRPFFCGMSVLMLTTVVIGFWSSYFSHGIVDAPLRSPLVHVHGAIFSLWIVLLLVQVGLVAAGNIKLHRTLGLAGFGLAVLIVIVGTLTATAQLQHNLDAHRKPAIPGYMLPMGDLILFAPLVFVAYRLRRKPAAHKRLILIATIALMGAPLSRFPITFLNHTVFGQSAVMLGFLLLIVTYDLFSLRRVERATIWGVAYGVFVHLIRFPVAFTPAWAWFAYRMAGRIKDSAYTGTQNVPLRRDKSVYRTPPPTFALGTQGLDTGFIK